MAEHTRHGHVKAYTYFGVDGAETLSNHGYSRVTYENDDLGNHIKETYLGLDGKPVASTMGIAGLTAHFDHLSHRTKVLYFDPAGKPMDSPSLLSRMTTKATKPPSRRAMPKASPSETSSASGAARQSTTATATNWRMLPTAPTVS